MDTMEFRKKEEGKMSNIIIKVRDIDKAFLDSWNWLLNLQVPTDLAFSLIYATDKIEAATQLFQEERMKLLENNPEDSEAYKSLFEELLNNPIELPIEKINIRNLTNTTSAKHLKFLEDILV